MDKPRLFHHFLITRFNLRLQHTGWSLDKSRSPTLTDQWMSERINIFEHYCLPSVVRQTVRDFTWFIFLDTTTAERYRAFIANLTASHNWIRLKYVEGLDAFNNKYCDYLLTEVHDGITHVITTRLDNDDMIHEDFISRIQEEFEQQSLVPVNMLKVLMLNPRKPNRIYVDYQRSNHFISLIERIGEAGIRGCYYRKDIQWSDSPGLIQVIDKAYCIESITERNLVNDYRGLPVFVSSDLSSFGFPGKKYRCDPFDPDNYKLSRLRLRNYLFYLRYKLKQKSAPIGTLLI